MEIILTTIFQEIIVKIMHYMFEQLKKVYISSNGEGVVN